MKTLKENLAGRDVSQDHIKQMDRYIKEYHDALRCECLGDGKSCYYEYVRIGTEYYKRDTTYYDLNDECHDCGIENIVGNTHHGTCDMELCPACGGQFLLDGNHIGMEVQLLARLPKGAKLTKSKFDYRDTLDELDEDIQQIMKDRNE